MTTKNVIIAAIAFSDYFRRNHGSGTMSASVPGNFAYHGTDSAGNAVMHYDGYDSSRGAVVVDGRIIDHFINERRRLKGQKPLKIGYDPKNPADRSYLFIMP